MNNIDFARGNAGKYYIYRGYKVKIVGYNCSEVVNCVIVSGYPWDWAWCTPSANYRLLVAVKRETDRFYFVSMDELKEIEEWLRTTGNLRK